MIVVAELPPLTLPEGVAAGHEPCLTLDSS